MDGRLVIVFSGFGDHEENEDDYNCQVGVQFVVFLTAEVHHGIWSYMTLQCICCFSSPQPLNYKSSLIYLKSITVIT